MKLSVLIPIYNVAAYLRECLDSLKAQSLTDVEFLCLNDGSTDDSRDIIIEYVTKDSRFKLLDKHNTGYGNTMNLGLDTAKGEYIAIVESDDYIAADMFENMLKLIEDSDADVVKSAFFSFSDANAVVEKQNSFRNLPIDKVFNPIENPWMFLVTQSIWSAIYKSSLIKENNIRFNETPGASFQDVSFAFQIFASTNKVLLTQEAYYYYRVSNPNSSMNSENKIDRLLGEIDRIIKIVDGSAKKTQLIPIASRLAYRILMEHYYIAYPAYQYTFLTELERQLRIYDNRGDFSAKIWDDEAVATAREILEDKNAFYKKIGKKIFDSRLWQGTINASVYKDAILTKAASYENIVLYGAGVVGSKVKDDLVNRGVQKSRLTFAVTSKSDNQDEKDGIPVKQIDEFKGSGDNTIFIITVKEEKQYEMLQNMQRLGIENVLYLSDEVRYSL